MKSIVLLLMLLIACICTAGPQVVLTFDAPDLNISGLGYGAGSLWAVDNTTEMVYRLDPANGSIQNSWYMSENASRTPSGLTFANNTVYVISILMPDLHAPVCYMYESSGAYLDYFSITC